MSFADIAKRVGKFTTDNSPTILTTLGVLGSVTTAILAGKASYEASSIIALKEGTEGVPEDPREQLKDRVKLVWKLYIPAVGTGAVTVACIIGANRIGTRRAAALATAYGISEVAFEKYRDKVIEKFGENKEREVRDEVAEDLICDHPVSTREVIVAGGGNVLCFDAYSKRYFESDVETIKAAQNRVNHMINNDYYASLTDFYDAVGLPATGYSDEVGWNADKLMEIQFSTMLAENKQPCIVINFVVEPIRGYYRVN